MKLNFYPKSNGEGFSGEEIKRGVHWLYADIECPHCKKLQSVANTGYVGGACIRCGKQTIGDMPE